MNKSDRNDQDQQILIICKVKIISLLVLKAGFVGGKGYLCLMQYRHIEELGVVQRQC